MRLKGPSRCAKCLCLAPPKGAQDTDTPAAVNRTGYRLKDKGQIWTFPTFYSAINIPKDQHIMDFDNSTIVLILYCILAFVLAFYPAYLIFPRFIRKMKALGNTGKDVNKRGNIQVAKP